MKSIAKNPLNGLLFVGILLFLSCELPTVVQSCCCTPYFNLPRHGAKVLAGCNIFNCNCDTYEGGYCGYQNMQCYSLWEHNKHCGGDGPIKASTECCDTCDTNRRRRSVQGNIL